MESITQLSKTDSSKQRGTLMQSRAILLIAIMVLASLSPLAATELDASVDSNDTSGRTGAISHIQYFGTWTGQNALVNQTTTTPISPMTIPLSATPDGYSISSDTVVPPGTNSQDWWTMNDVSLTDIGSGPNNPIYLNGNTNWIPQGKAYGAVELGGSSGDYINSTSCANTQQCTGEWTRYRWLV